MRRGLPHLGPRDRIRPVGALAVALVAVLLAGVSADPAGAGPAQDPATTTIPDDGSTTTVPTTVPATTVPSTTTLPTTVPSTTVPSTTSAPPTTAPPTSAPDPTAAGAPPVVDALAAAEVSDAEVRNVLLALAAGVRTGRIDALTRAVTGVDAELRSVGERLNDTTSRLDAARRTAGEEQDRVTLLRRRLSSLARDAFMRVATDDDGLLAALRAGSGVVDDATTTDARQARVFAGHAAAAGGSDLRDAEHAREAADGTVAVLDAERAALAAQEGALVTAASRLRVELDALLAQPVEVGAAPTDPLAVEAARRAAEVGGGPTILGPTVLGAEDLAAFVRSRSRPHPEVDLDALARAFVDEGVAEGVRADLAWAQSIIETGWFGFANSMVAPGDHNYAGIGACDSCSTGFRYDTPELGVRAQIQLLRTYADPAVTAATLARPAAGRAPERVHVRGCCDTWMALSGVWATGPGYGRKILAVYADMVAFAAARRA